MTAWTERIPLAVPVDLFGADTLAIINRLSAIIDPDSGGWDTWADGQQHVGYYVTACPFTTQFWPIVQARDPATWQAAIAARATAKGIEPLTADQIETIRSEILIGDECAGIDGP